MSTSHSPNPSSQAARVLEINRREKAARRAEVRSLQLIRQFLHSVQQQASLVAAAVEEGNLAGPVALPGAGGTLYSLTSSDWSVRRAQSQHRRAIAAMVEVPSDDAPDWLEPLNSILGWLLVFLDHCRNAVAKRGQVDQDMVQVLRHLTGRVLHEVNHRLKHLDETGSLAFGQLAGSLAGADVTRAGVPETPALEVVGPAADPVLITQEQLPAAMDDLQGFLRLRIKRRKWGEMNAAYHLPHGSNELSQLKRLANHVAQLVDDAGLYRVIAHLEGEWPAKLPAAQTPSGVYLLPSGMVQWEEAMVELRGAAAATQRHAGGGVDLPVLLPAVDDEDLRILGALVERSPQLLTQDKIEVESRVSRRTISARMPDLLKNGLVVQPKGKKSGTTVTDLGKRVVKETDPPKAAQ